MLSYAAVRGREQRGDRRPLPPQALPIILHPVVLPQGCLVWLHQHGPAQDPQFWPPYASQAMDLLPACVKEYPLVGHRPTIGSHLLATILPRTKPCPVASRTWTSPKALPITTQSLALPIVLGDPGISGAHWGLPAPPCRVWRHGLSSFSQSRDTPCWFPCWQKDQAGAMPCHAMPCYGFQQGRSEVEGGWHSQWNPRQ